MHYKSASYSVFTGFNLIFLGVLSIACVLPLVHILAVSFSATHAATANLVKLWPVDFTLDAWNETIKNRNFFQAFINGVSRTVLGTLISMVLVLLSSYALSKEDHMFKGRRFYMYAFVFTMLFNGGLIPTYILMRNLDLMNTVWALVLPTAVNVWNMILMLNFFRSSVPKALEESAFIDGANHFKTFVYVYLPISLPAIVTVGLFTMVFQWNSWFDGLIFITDQAKYPLSTFLQTIIVQQNTNVLGITDPDELKNLSERTVRSAQIFIGALPIVAVYPFLQRFFIKGIVLGSVKE